MVAIAISPLYTIHQYREDIYKVVAFKGVRDPDSYLFRETENVQHNDRKLDNNFSRARSMVLQYALCNPWDYFFTGTLDRRKFDRYNLDTYAGKLMQFIRDKRKKYAASFQVLLVPEHHKDGAWHMHGLVFGLPETALCPFAPPAPQKLIENGFLNWPDYMEKFGFCSLAPIRDPIATAFYISKYVSKDLSQRAKELGKHLYFHSRPLKKAEKASDVYWHNQRLEDCCTHEYDFCKVGMVEGVNWMFPYQWDGVDFPCEELPSMRPIAEPLQDFDPQTIDPFWDGSFEQSTFL